MLSIVHVVIYDNNFKYENICLLYNIQTISHRYNKSTV